MAASDSGRDGPAAAAPLSGGRGADRALLDSKKTRRGASISTSPAFTSLGPSFGLLPAAPSPPEPPSGAAAAASAPPSSPSASRGASSSRMASSSSASPSRFV